MSLHRNDDDYINFLAEELVKEASKNIDNQPNFEQDEDFGLVPDKPVYTLFEKLVDGEKEYLNNLYTSDGHKISWKRTGSVSLKNVGGSVDCYDTFLPSGEFYKTIYINMYGSKESVKVPAGFQKISTAVDKKSIQPSKEVKHPKVCTACGKANPEDSEFCQYCGKKIEIVEEIKNIAPTEKGADKSNSSKLFKIACCIIAVLLFLNIYQCSMYFSISGELEKTQSSEEFYETRYKDTMKSLSEYKSKYYEITNFLKSSDAGYANSNYYASDSIVVLNKNGFSKSVLITCKYYYTTISYSNSNKFVAHAEWDDNWNGNSINITFSPGDTGTSIITFTNDYNSASFRVMVIVV